MSLQRDTFVISFWGIYVASPLILVCTIRHFVELVRTVVQQGIRITTHNKARGTHMRKSFVAEQVSPKEIAKTCFNFLGNGRYCRFCWRNAPIGTNVERSTKRDCITASPERLDGVNLLAPANKCRRVKRHYFSARIPSTEPRKNMIVNKIKIPSSAAITRSVLRTIPSFLASSECLETAERNC